jgi:hypothetical protein
MPVFILVVIGNLFPDHQSGSLLPRFWNLKTAIYDSSSMGDKIMNVEDLILIEYIDQVEETSNDVNIRVNNQITTPDYFTGTATLPPIPTYTLLFPKVTETSQLLHANRYPEESEITKKERIPFWFSLRRFWPFVMLIVLWVVISIWYIFSQLIID